MAQEFGSETQSQSAERMYNARASNYEDSWHPDYSKRFIALAFLAAEVVGRSGGILGVDVSSEMLEQLRQRQKQEPVLGQRIRTFNHDVTDLAGIPGVEKGSFDAILCSCAFVLLGNPAQVVAHWKEYLKPGGLMAIDVTHEKNLRPGLVLEQVAKRLGVNFPSERLWIQSIDSFKEVLEGQGLLVEKAVGLDRVSGKGSVFYGVDEADAQYEWTMNSSLTQNSSSESFKVKAKSLFREEWERIAVNGKVESVDVSYMYVARAPR
ncbi:hypothetical protein diail_1261 [Diaporthe ilicicola]|nr:hypothetical protein diail_1261 [Diaporthe ilicicola]